MAKHLPWSRLLDTQIVDALHFIQPLIDTVLPSIIYHYKYNIVFGFLRNTQSRIQECR